MRETECSQRKESQGNSTNKLSLLNTQQKDTLAEGRTSRKRKRNIIITEKREEYKQGRDAE